jgi:uncharacterized protein YgbK (DUF1537 family)
MSSRGNPAPIIILADDLSGAAELAGVAYMHGLTAEVQRQFDPTSSAEVLAIDTDSRGLAASAAAERLHALAGQIAAARPAWIYKKTDSVLRGQPRAEIEAILNATGHERALLIPANPSKGRVVSNGQYFIDGVPLDKTYFAHDPEHPRKSAAIHDLLGKSSGPTDAIEVPDVATVNDLRQHASRNQANTLAAGAADFFAALLEARIDPSRGQTGACSPQMVAPALLVCGSRAAWSQRQRQCAAAGLPALKLSPNDSFSATQQAVQRLQTGGAVVLSVDDAASEHSDPLSLLADATEHIARHVRLATLLAEGGATAAAIAQRLDWTRMSVCGAAEGVGILQPVAGAVGWAMPTNPPLNFIIKPGSYPWPNEIWTSLCRLV